LNRSLVRALALAFVGAVTVLPATALADNTSPNETELKHKRSAPQFPMDAQQFRELVAKHIERARKHLDKQLDVHKVPAATQAEIRKHFDEAAKQVRAAVDRVAADGTVTKDEAKEVRLLAKDLKRKAMAHMRGQARAHKNA